MRYFGARTGGNAGACHKAGSLDSYHDVLCIGQGHGEHLQFRTLAPYFASASKVKGAIVQWADHRAAAKQPVGEWAIAVGAIRLRSENLVVVGAKNRDLLFSNDKAPSFARRDLVDGSD
jgi:hypothetical protein